MIDARDFLESISGFDSGAKSSADKPVRLGTIDAAYTSGLAKIKFDGDTTSSVKGYAWLDPYVPTAGDRVALLPVGQSYLIIGKVSQTKPFTRHAEFGIAASGFSVSGGQVWDIGPLVEITGTGGSENNNFATTGTASGSLNISKDGYYEFQCLSVPRGNPGASWLKLSNTTTGITLGMGGTGGYQWESFVSTAPIWIGAGQTVRFTCQTSNTQIWDSRVRIHKLVQ